MKQVTDSTAKKLEITVDATANIAPIIRHNWISFFSPSISTIFPNINTCITTPKIELIVIIVAIFFGVKPNL
jgi:hypothetical protein